MSTKPHVTPYIRLSFRTSVDDHGSMYGRGIAELCRGIRATGSLNKATKEMGMAYSKAWRIIKHTEEELGIQLLERQGAHGSCLTEQGLALLEAYDELEKDLSQYADQRLKEILK